MYIYTYITYVILLGQVDRSASNSTTCMEINVIWILSQSIEEGEMRHYRRRAREVEWGGEAIVPSWPALV